MLLIFHQLQTHPSDPNDECLTFRKKDIRYTYIRKAISGKNDYFCTQKTI